MGTRKKKEMIFERHFLVITNKNGDESVRDVGKWSRWKRKKEKNRDSAQYGFSRAEHGLPWALRILGAQKIVGWAHLKSSQIKPKKNIANYCIILIYDKTNFYNNFFIFRPNLSFHR